VGNGQGRRGGPGAFTAQHGPDLFAADPARFGDFRSVEGEFEPFGLGERAHHQAGREGPGLACSVADGVDPDAGFLVQFAGDGFFQRFAGLHESGKRREETGREVRAAADQGHPVFFGEHDDHRVDTREMFGSAAVALAAVTGLFRAGGCTAIGAKAVPAVPIENGARLRDDGGAAICQHCAGSTGICGDAGEIGVGLAIHCEARFAIGIEAKEDLLAIRALAPTGPEQIRSALGHQRLQIIEDEEAGGGMHACGVDGS